MDFRGKIQEKGTKHNEKRGQNIARKGVNYREIWVKYSKKGVKHRKKIGENIGDIIKHERTKNIGDVTKHE